MFQGTCVYEGILKRKKRFTGTKRVRVVIRGFSLIQYKKDNQIEEEIDLKHVNNLFFSVPSSGESLEYSIMIYSDDPAKKDQPVIFFGKDYLESLQWFILLRATVMFFKRANSSLLPATLVYEHARSMNRKNRHIRSSSDKQLAAIGHLCSVKTNRKTGFSKVVRALSKDIKELMVKKDFFLDRKLQLEKYMSMSNWETRVKFLKLFQKVLEMLVFLCDFKVTFLLKRIQTLAAEQKELLEQRKKFAMSPPRKSDGRKKKKKKKRKKKKKKKGKDRMERPLSVKFQLHGRMYYDYEIDLIYIELSKDEELMEKIRMFYRHVSKLLGMVPELVDTNREYLHYYMDAMNQLQEAGISQVNSFNVDFFSGEKGGKANSERVKKMEKKLQRASRRQSSRAVHLQIKIKEKEYYIHLYKVKQIRTVLATLKRMGGLDASAFRGEECLDRALFNELEFVYLPRPALMRKLESMAMKDEEYFSCLMQLQKTLTQKYFLSISNLKNVSEQLEKDLRADVSRLHALETKYTNLVSSSKKEFDFNIDNSSRGHDMAKIKKQLFNIKNHEILKNQIDLCKMKINVASIKCKAKKDKIDELKHKLKSFHGKLNESCITCATPYRQMAMKRHQRTLSNSLSYRGNLRISRSATSMQGAMSATSMSLNVGNLQTMSPKQFHVLFKYTHLNSFFFHNWQLLYHKILVLLDQRDERLGKMNKTIPVLSHKLTQAKKEKILDQLVIEVVDDKSEISKIIGDYVQNVLADKEEEIYSLDNLPSFIQYITELLCKKRKYLDNQQIEVEDIYEIIEKGVFTPEIYAKTMLFVTMSDKDKMFVENCMKIRKVLELKVLTDQNYFSNLTDEQKEWKMEEIIMQYFKDSIENLTEINNQNSPLSKLKVIFSLCRSIIKQIMHLTGKDDKSIGSDDFLPVLISVVSCSNNPNLVSQAEFLQKFAFERLSISQYGFYFCSVKSACQFILEYKEDDEDSMNENKEPMNENEEGTVNENEEYKNKNKELMNENEEGSKKENEEPLNEEGIVS